MHGTAISLNALREQDLLSRESRSRERLSALAQAQSQQDALAAAALQQHAQVQSQLSALRSGGSAGRAVSDVRLPMPPPPPPS